MAIGESFRVEQAFLPMMLIGGVRFVVGTRVGLSTLERFALEVLVALGPSDPRVLEDLVAIPPRVGSWLLGSLTQKGLAQEGHTGAFEIRRENASLALASGEVVSEREEVADVLWFPQSGEAIAFPSGSVEANIVGDLKPIGHWPLSPEDFGAEVSTILSSTLESQRLYGPLAGVINRFGECGRLDHESCPGYVCSASALATGPEEPWTIAIRVRGEGRRMGSENAAHELSFCLPHAEAGWRSAFEEVATDLHDQLTERWGLGEIDAGPWQVRASLRGEELRRLAHDRLARRVLGLRVEIGDELILRLPMSIEPADDDASELISFDEELCKLISGDIEPGEVSTSRRERFYDRLWQLRLFEHLYKFRESEDFLS